MVQLEFKPAPLASKLAQDFRNWHGKHPEVYELLVRFAREWRRVRGDDAICGMKMLWERVRWEMSIKKQDGEVWAYKCNNNHTAFYARKIMDENPDLDGIFELRQQTHII